MVDDVRRVGDSVDVVCFEFCVLPTALLLGQSPTSWCLCRTVSVKVRLVDDVRRVGDSVDVLRPTRVVSIHHFITRPSRSNSLIGYAWFVWIIISLHTLPGLCRPSIRCTS